MTVLHLQKQNFNPLPFDPAQLNKNKINLLNKIFND